MAKEKWASLRLLIVLVLFSACSNKEQPADLILFNANIITLTGSDSFTSIGIVDDKIQYLGSDSDYEEWLSEDGTMTIDMQGAFIYPGFTESHGHLMSMGFLESRVNLLTTKSYSDLIELVKSSITNYDNGDWILGRGWHQSKWSEYGKSVKGFPTHTRLSEASPNNPVFLNHASGHAGIANAKAMELAGIDETTVFNGGGEIIKDEEGNPTGIFTEDAMTLITDHIPAAEDKDRRRALDAGLQNAYENGITAFHDAWVSGEYYDLYKTYDEEEKLDLRVYAMLDAHDTVLIEDWLKKGPIEGDHLTVRAFKLTSDGALGSRGAWLLESYCDRPDHTGHSTVDLDYLEYIATSAMENGFQLGTHAIGDRANREVLDRYEKAFAKYPANKDHRFRIEHAQHLSSSDIPRFADLGVIASMQGIHMASDRPWAIDRLCEDRILEGAYVWQKLFESGATIINGTDCPVEPINPLACYYASVTRKTLEGLPEGGYEADQKMSRLEALKTYTIDAAYGGFMEDKKGTIEIGKWADFTILSNDLLRCAEDEILSTEVLMTIIGGKIVYERDETN